MADAFTKVVGHTYSIMDFNAGVQYFGCFFVAVYYKERSTRKTEFMRLRLSIKTRLLVLRLFMTVEIR